MALSPHIKDFPTLLRDLNKELERLGLDLQRTPKLDKDGNLDLQGRRIMRVGKTKAQDDVPAKKELQAVALFETPTGHHKAKSAIIAPGGVRTTRRAKEPDELVPLRQVRDLIGAGSVSSAVLTTNVDQTILGYKQFFGLLFAQVALSCVNGINGTIPLATLSGPLGCFIRITGPSAAYSIQGMQRHTGLTGNGGYNGQFALLFNSTNQVLTLMNESTSEVIPNRFMLPNAANIQVQKKGTVALLYSELDSRWVCFDTPR